MSKKVLEEMLVLIEEFISLFPPDQQKHLRFRSNEIYKMIHPPADDKRQKFTRPTVDDVRRYCESRKNQVDPEQFHDFYSSKGWKVGRNTMSDWKAAVRTWERREGQAPRQPAGRFTPEITVQEACPEPEGEVGVPDDIQDLIRKAGL